MRNFATTVSFFLMPLSANAKTTADASIDDAPAIRHVAAEHIAGWRDSNYFTLYKSNSE